MGQRFGFLVTSEDFPRLLLEWKMRDVVWSLIEVYSMFCRIQRLSYSYRSLYYAAQCNAQATTTHREKDA
jgi:hypothetical protein